MEMIGSILAAEHFRDDNQRSPSLPTLQAVQADVLGMAEYQPEIRLPYRESWIGWVVPSYARASSARNLYPVAARHHGRGYTRACRGEEQQTQRRHGRQNRRHGARRSHAICSVAQKAIRTSPLRTRLTTAFRKNSKVQSCSPDRSKIAGPPSFFCGLWVSLSPNRTSDLDPPIKAAANPLLLRCGLR